MATDKVDMSLDDIIKANRSSFRTGRGGRGGSRGGRGGGARRGGFGGGGPSRNGGGPRRSFGSSGRGSSTNNRGKGKTFVGRGSPQKNSNSDRWQHDKFRSGGASNNGAIGGGSMPASAKLTVTNLDYGVSDADIKELFTEFGPLKKAAIHYDRSGRSLGTADVIFERRTDAIRALKQYNGVPLDGRPMKIEIVGGTEPPRPAGGNKILSGRIGKKPSPTVNRARPTRGGGRGMNPRPSRGGRFNNSRGGPGGGRGGGKPRGAAKKPPTKEELDAQLDAYNSKMDTN